MHKKIPLGWWLPVVILPVAVLAVFYNSNVLDSPFVFDDDHVILRNADVRSSDVSKGFVRNIMGRALVVRTFAANYRSSGLDVSGYHATNIAIHIFNGLIVYALIWQLLSMPKLNTERTHRYLVSCFGALLFCLHPVQTQAVIYISQRFTLVAAGFYMTSVLLFLMARRYQLRTEKAWQPAGVLMMAGSFAAGTAAVLSKQNSVSLPLMLLAVEFILVESSWIAWKKRLPFLILGGIVGAAMIMGFAGMFKGGWTFSSVLEKIDYFTRENRFVSRWDYLCTQFEVIVIYLKLCFWPSGLHLDWQYPFSKGLFEGYSLYAAIVLSLLVTLGIRFRKNYPLVLFGIAWFFITLSVESSIIPIRDALVEHRLYLPLSGVIVPVLHLFFERLSKKLMVAVFLAIILTVAAGAASLMRTEVWKDEVSLWRDSAEKSPDNPKAWLNLGTAYGKTGHYDKAKKALLETIKLTPDNAKAYQGLGNIADIMKNPQKAETYYRQAIKVDPRAHEAYYSLGMFYLRQHRTGEAIQYLSRANGLHRNNPVYSLLLGKAYVMNKDYRKAYDSLASMVSFFPEYNAEPYVLLAISAAHLKKSRDEVVSMLERAGRLGFNRWDSIRRDQAVSDLVGFETFARLKSGG